MLALVLALGRQAVAKKRKHPGVTLVQPIPARERIDPKTGEVKRSGATWWGVRFVDADTGRTVRKTLDRTLTTIAAREDYAVRLSERLGRRRLELEGGAVRATGTPLGAAEKRFSYCIRRSNRIIQLTGSSS